MPIEFMNMRDRSIPTEPIAMGCGVAGFVVGFSVEAIPEILRNAEANVESEQKNQIKQVYAQSANSSSLAAVHPRPLLTLNEARPAIVTGLECALGAFALCYIASNVLKNACARAERRHLPLHSPKNETAPLILDDETLDEYFPPRTLEPVVDYDIDEPKGEIDLSFLFDDPPTE